MRELNRVRDNGSNTSSVTIASFKSSVEMQKWVGGPSRAGGTKGAQGTELSHKHTEMGPLMPAL